jgi:hypothetical protein
MDSITAYAQDLDILLFEPADGLPERASLAGSTRGEVKHVKGQNHVLLSFVAAQ